MRKKLILVEFNELSHVLMNKFIQAGHLPQFRKLYEMSEVYTTDAKASGSQLNPWVQWVSVHTGLSDDEHGVTRLNEANKCSEHFIWNKLSKHGVKSWICGSMNTSYSKDFDGHLLPDPWSNNVDPFPPEKFETYYDFVSQSVQNHALKAEVPPLSFLNYMLRSGLTVTTILRIVSQLIKEKIDSSVRWKRASVLDWIQFDLFKYVYFKNKPDFSTFFLNSTAHYQHHYWRDMDPDIFNLKNLEDKENSQKLAILTGYKNMDNLLGKILKMADEKTCVIFCTALSQKPYTGENTDSQRHYYHIVDEALLKTKLGLKESYNYSPVMAEQFHIELDSPEQAQSAYNFLKSFKMDNNSYFHVGSDDLFLLTIKGNKVYAQCRCTKEVSKDAKIICNELSIPFYDVFYLMDDVKSGVHDPVGMLWIKDQKTKHLIHDEPRDLDFIPKYILDYFLDPAM